MASSSKRSGDRWERELAKLLDGRRQPSSGAFGSQHKEPTLTGDVVVKYPWWGKKLHIECKYGYGGAQQMTIKRGWFDKVRQEATLARRHPAVAIKFRDVTGGDREAAKIICINIDTWNALMDEIETLYLDYLNLLKESYEGKEDG